MEYLNFQRDGEPWNDVAYDFSKLAATRTANKIKGDIFRNGEGLTAFGTFASVIPVVGQVVAIAATIIGVVQMSNTAKKLQNLQSIQLKDQELQMYIAGELSEENLQGQFTLEYYKDKLNYIREVKKAHQQTLLISGGFILTTTAILILSRKK